VELKPGDIERAFEEMRVLGVDVVTSLECGKAAALR
jgi:hypothetical protein